jgi:hypothetical protein
MNLLIRLIPLVFACAAADAFAGDTPASTDSASAAARPAPVVLQDKTLTQAEVNRMLSQGYKPKKGRGDDVLYCRDEAAMGTHFTRTVCLTAQQIKQRTQDSREITDRLETNGGLKTNGH